MEKSSWLYIQKIGRWFFRCLPDLHILVVNKYALWDLIVAYLHCIMLCFYSFFSIRTDETSIKIYFLPTHTFHCDDRKFYSWHKLVITFILKICAFPTHILLRNIISHSSLNISVDEPSFSDFLRIEECLHPSVSWGFWNKNHSCDWKI